MGQKKMSQMIGCQLHFKTTCKKKLQIFFIFAIFSQKKPHQNEEDFQMQKKTSAMYRG